MQVCISLQTDNHARTPPLSFLQAGCPSCRPTNSIKALKATTTAQLDTADSVCSLYKFSSCTPVRKKDTNGSGTTSEMLEMTWSDQQTETQDSVK